ncbi:hypothetical protein [Nannocystis sp. SCPEA4]|uniref:hypothetical protein n=1 Tax=Nannocystis sp. SCPEA4 TaxID=2996787 RepID=UPI00226FB1AC|nr:hypothetical protein [Nannocystis sp. SCPEA4]MCY1061822.1 hypothetical protein [Nannocystis sp. SCPEA4]
MQVVIHRLWPDVGDDWYESALHLVDCCEDAGLPPAQWGPLLCAQFPALLA